MAQKNDSQLTTEKELIKNETIANANTATRVGTMLEGIIDSKINNDKIIDEDNMSSNSAVHVPTQQSVKAYVDGAVSGATIADASDTVKGKVELATNAEAVTGTDTVRAVTPAGAKAAIDDKVSITSQQVGFGSSSNKLVGDSKFKWDSTNRRLVAGNGTTSSGTDNVNFGNNTTLTGSWALTVAEESTVRGSNSLSSGWHHTIGDGINSGSGAGGCTVGTDHRNNGTHAFVSGFGAKVNYNGGVGDGGFVHSFGSVESVDGLKPSDVPFLTVNDGAGAISRNTDAQTDGNGALARDSFILAGINGHIPVNATGSVLIGTNGKSIPSGETYHTGVDGLYIFQAPQTDNTLTDIIVRDDSTGKLKKADRSVIAPKALVIACSDETTPLTVGTQKVSFRMPYAMTLTGVYADLVTPQTSGSIFTVNIKKNGVTILSTLITIDNTEDDSSTASTPPVISVSSLALRDKITADITQLGDGTATGLKISLVGI